jgi:hypothetical protein
MSIIASNITVGIIVIPHVVSFILVCCGVFYGLKYTERPYLRSKCRNAGLVIHNYITRYEFMKYVMFIVSQYILFQCVCIMELTTGFLEGITYMEPLYDITEDSTVNTENPIISTENPIINTVNTVNTEEKEPIINKYKTIDISDGENDNNDDDNENESYNDISPVNKFGESSTVVHTVRENSGNVSIKKVAGNSKKIILNINRA